LSCSKAARADFSVCAAFLLRIVRRLARRKIHVQSYPGPGGKWQISTEGGTEPVWNRNGRELFYRNGDKIIAVDIATQPSFVAGTRAL
jgi:hypothetical protein